ncbi:MAG: hypothetical protein DLM61_14660 [Pseudonocardiales bacterium]|nr:hypothetical protein [Pseudonocardiales bacterium]PZS28529.1 MAG: hypothetical protein DLM61_14660 [Pseudonocardiales bacterium]
MISAAPKQALSHWQTSRWRRVAYWDSAAVLVIAAVSVFSAGWLPIGEMTPWAQLVASRPQLGVGLLILAAVIGLVRAVRSLCLILARASVDEIAVHDITGTDHRALLATVTP